MKPKTRRILIWMVILAGGVLACYGLFNFLTPHSTVEATSPDRKYVATVRSTFPLSGGYHYDINVRSSDGQAVDHLVINDQIIGWGHDPSVIWTPDSRTVTVGLQDGDTDGRPPVAYKRISIDVQWPSGGQQPAAAPEVLTSK